MNTITKHCVPDFSAGRIYSGERLRTVSLCALGVLISFLMFIAAPAEAAAEKQRMFDSPESAVKALMKAVRSHDTKALLRLLGPEATSVISSGDAVADLHGQDRFVKKYDEKHRLAENADGSMTLHVGADDYPLPIPVAKRGKLWYFDTVAGKDEILCRRIGRNELNAIDVLREYVHAQREYAAKDRNSDGVFEYAQKLNSTPGRQDGLYWDASGGKEESPFGPLVAKASKRGYGSGTGDAVPNPYRGYFFNILASQGANAKGGAYDYVVNGKMILGFAMVAYPAQYGVSGVMTFVVSQEGVVYQKDIGMETEKVAGAMTIFDPDASWKQVE